ncbi:heptaprenyl diphosphate synthase component II [Niallia endozanthoxylica]|uniref:Heptaprenyl diphosphate synthase component 2 n=1 Tax=Niallia endozanthoxylica TaxID=2036016 RepID=A0A5J5HW69_9BACI|nr:heptaprenyl diphosphate synthase component II [Niallia endozanthoxylica]KAA9026127.1 heptaprenyl diphosphate synthase component II [Niallia endozanthoxylica]
MKFKMMYSFLNSDIDIVEEALEEAVYADSALLQEASLHLLQAGGKRIRPLFVLLAAKFGSYDIHTIKKAAVALELIHAASLIHDDVIDDAEIRRGKLTVKAKWDNRIAMYTGDYIFARSLELMTEIEKADAHIILSDTMVELVIGEIEQIKDKYRFDQNVKDYLRRIKRKTALLISTSCELGAICADVEKNLQTKLARFGYYVGMSYQIIDDILDFTSTEKELGKPSGSDLLQGNITLPVLFAMEDVSIRKEIVKVHEKMPRKEMDQIIKMIIRSGAIDKSRNISNRYLEKALELVEEFPQNQAKTALKNIAKYIGKRKY